MSAIAVVGERMPTRLSGSLTTPSGRTYRWAADEPDAENAVSDINCSDTMPGGFESGTGTLARDPAVDYEDLRELSTLRFEGVGEQLAYEGRLETSPRTSGNEMKIAPGTVGWQAHLEDDKSAREIYLDQDRSHWQGNSTSEKIAAANAGYDLEDGQSVWDTGDTDGDQGEPAIVLQWTGAWTAPHAAQVMYDAHGIPIRQVDYAWKIAANVPYDDDAWEWTAGLSANDHPFDGGALWSSNLLAAGPGSGAVGADTRDYTFAMLLLADNWPEGGGGDGVIYALNWTQSTVQGFHSAPVYGSGVLASDVVSDAVRRWAPKLALSRNGVSTVQPSSFAIPHIAFLDFTTVAAIVKEAVKYEMLDFWVDEGPTFNLAPRDGHGRRWRARVGPSGLSETGPQIDRVWNSVVVSYKDTAGQTRTVGPAGSGADTTDNSLVDSDPQNPATLAGLTRRTTIEMSATTTVDGAAAVGRVFLAQTVARSTAGRAELQGWVQDADTAVWWPSWKVRAGDRVIFTDSHDPARERRIVKKSYSHSNRTAGIDLDQPPEGMQELLERLAIEQVAVGIQ